MSRSSSNHTNILDRPLGRASRSTSNTSNDNVSLSYFAYLFSELVQYHQNRVDSIIELERKLECTGYNIGIKIIEYTGCKQREYKREIRLMNILQYISTQIWKQLFGKVADSLERSIDHVEQFMIIDYHPITSTFISVPQDMGGSTTIVDSYISGLITGILYGANFNATVTAHSVSLDDNEDIPPSNVILSGGINTNANTSAMLATNTGAGGIGANQQYHHGGMGTAVGVGQGGGGIGHPGGVGGGVGASQGGIGTSPYGTSSAFGGYGAGSSAGGGGGGLAEIGGLTTLPPRHEKTVFLVKFEPSVLSRDDALS